MNEDVAYISKRYAFVLDGATGLSKKNITGVGTDAYWYSHAMSNYLKSNLLDYSKNLRKIICEGIQSLSSDYERLLKAQEISPIDMPSAVGCLTRVNNQKLEYLVYGDSPLLIKYKNDKVEEVYDEKLMRLDNYVLEKCKLYAQEKEITFREALPSFIDIIKRNRLKMNTPEGYYNLSFYADAAYEGGLYGEINLKDIDSICIMSDGFADCYTLMGIVATASDFMESLPTEGPEQLYKKLLRAQYEDSALDNFPRFKLSDDASCVYADL